jgi:drug/metabolite transporter (DMT)-like permease
MIRSNEAISLLLVGALWGCTNPFMRKGSIESKSSSTVTAQEEKEEETKSSVLRSVFRLAKIRVWLPYLVNQLGSLLYYKQLASSNLTLSVPICNAAAMVFSCITSFILGERVNQPGRAALGVILVLLGVQICMYSSGESLSMEDST